MSRIETVTRMMQAPFHLGEAREKPVQKEFDTVLAEAMEKQKRISGDFDKLKARQALSVDNIYGDGAFKWQ